MSETKTIHCGVIGYGGAFNMGRAHLNQMKQAGMTPAAVCEIDPARLAVATTDFPGIATFATAEEMLAESDVELVTIITPHNTHAPLAIQCLKAGRHVVSEKPLAITTAECDAIIAAAETSGKMASTYHNRHWDGHVLSAVDAIVKEGKIGDVVRIDIYWGGRGEPRDWWRSDRAISGGILYDWGVHLLEYALQLVPGQTVTEVTGFAHNGYWLARATEKKPWHANANEDEARLIARLSGGGSIELIVSSIDAVGRANTFEVIGTGGHYAMNFGGWKITKKDGGKTTTEAGGNRPEEGAKFYENIFAHLTRGEPLIITPQYARRMIHVLDLAVQSAKAGKALAAKYG